MDGFCFRAEPMGDDSLERWVKIGSGGFGEIYRAKHTRWGTDVAVKILHYTDGSSSSIQREALLMFQAGNPNVMRVLGLYEGRVGSCEGPLRSGLLMVFMPRGSVADLLRDTRPPWALAFRLAHQISLGMNFLHQASPPILHLDLKPSNVLLDDSLNAKITDFGLSRVARSVSKRSRERDEDEGGTLIYMPPEALESINYTACRASDVYSFGILLWSIITGKEPYSNAPSSLVRFRIPLGDRPDLTLIEASAAEGLDEVVKLMTDCWSGDPQRRPSFLDCVAATEQIYDRHKRGVNDAVHHVLKLLDGEICSGLKSMQISCETQNETRPQVSPCITGPLPKQETSPSHYTQTDKTESMPRPAATASQTPQVLQRQTSTPGGIRINMSNAFGVQIGNYNSMNIQRVRQRHQTAPSRVGTSEIGPEKSLGKPS